MSVAQYVSYKPSVRVVRNTPDLLRGLAEARGMKLAAYIGHFLDKLAAGEVEAV